jgi:hypothetical protein
MTSQREPGARAQDPARAGAQMWEAGYQQLAEGWAQAQEFWSRLARSWGDAAGAWMQPGTPSGESLVVIRELNEAAFAVAQAWMRMPLVLMGGASPADLQDATTRLTQAQGRAYQLWLEAIGRVSQPAATAKKEK